MGEKFFILQLDDEGFDRLRFWLKIENGKVEDFVVQYETLINEEWFPVIRYDLAHDFFHRDVMNPRGEKEKTAIPIDNLKDALKFAEQDLKDRWEFYKERFLKHIKRKK